MTPETDAAVKASNGQWSFVLKETCQRLERERNEWAALCGQYKAERDEARAKYATEATEHMLAVNKLCNERDEAREDARLLAERLTRLELDSSLALAKLERERNELKKALEAAK